MDGTNTADSEPIGLQAFDKLQAEAEPWLLDTFEKPAEFDLICRPRSSLIFGDSGSGKTAIYQFLKRNSTLDGERPTRLIVEWRPKPLRASDEINSEIVEKQVEQILDICALSLLTHLGHYPDSFEEAPEWVQENLIWYIQTYLKGNFSSRTRRLRGQASEQGQALLDLLDAHDEVVDGPLGPDPYQEEVMMELTYALKQLHIADVWVLVDGLETRGDVTPQLLTDALRTFLSTLNLFEQADFVYKFFLPNRLKPHLSGSSSVERRRVSTHYLRWERDKLTDLVRQRINFALDKEFQDLTEICEDETLTTWLERCGGHNPRSWLESMRPLVAAYLEQENSGPITETEWRVIRRHHPPILFLRPDTHHVHVGERKITNLTEQQYDLLSFMYERRGEVCTRSQLYYLADLKLEREPRNKDDISWEAPKEYSGKLDTAIWRLRQLLEPDPNDKNPLFIVTEKGKGYRLENAFD